ncbi:MAG: hypothetical protein CME70_23925 [Halobacteriovorax sp.]|nr:hypothetical protein [Halobacteriovorax sp.]|tara:strand:- start:33155 stop:34189 length:1035 start_codon:yes stop_codon:yes gene_type:complete
MSDIKWKHKRFEDSDTEGVLKLREAVFNEPEYDFSRWSWQYKANPMGESFIDLAVDKEDSSKLAGHYAVISYQMNIEAKISHVAQSLDTFTSGDYRRQGIFVALAEKTYENSLNNGVEYIFGFPNESSYPGFVKKLKFIDPFGFDLYKLPLKLGYFTSKIPGGNLLGGFKLKSSKCPDGQTSEEIKEVPKGYEELYSSFKGIAKNHIDRDAAYLKWRYFDCPDRKYKLFKISLNGKLEALVVFGLDEENSYIHLVDLIFSKKENLSSIVDHAVYLASSEPYNSMSIYLNESNILCSILEGKGFKHVTKKDSFRFILRNLNEDEYSSEVKDPNNWYITGGDTDFY